MIIKSSSKKSITIKICGITETSQAREIAKLRVNAIGVIGVRNSPRFVSKEKCSEIFHAVEEISSSIEKVLVVANKKIEEMKYINNGSNQPSVIQLHGNESVEYCKKFKNKFPKIKLWKAFRVKSINDLQNISQYEKSVDAILLDAWNDKYLGGTGNRIPLEFLINKTHTLPWLLAGGISEEIIPEIFSKIRPNGIDASSQLEISPGIKDLQKVKSLVKIIREKIDIKPTQASIKTHQKQA